MTPTCLAPAQVPSSSEPSTNRHVIAAGFWKDWIVSLKTPATPMDATPFNALIPDVILYRGREHRPGCAAVFRLY